MSWAEAELKDADLGDVRRTRRLIRVVEDLAAQPNASVPQASRDAAALQGTYDFWANRRIAPDAILGAHRNRTIERIIEHDTVLAIQDTSELDYSTHPGTRGLGPISHAAAQGMKVHSVLAVSAAGVPLGVLHQVVWTRESPRPPRGSQRQRLIADKESGRWLDSLDAYQDVIPQRIQVITIADREADIYEFFAHPRRPHSEFLIRAAQNRNTRPAADTGATTPLFVAIHQVPCAGEITLYLHRTPRRAPRVATLGVRFTEVWLQPPAHLNQKAPLKVWVILAEERTPPEGEPPIYWLLLTTIPVTDLATAQQCLIWYSYRWLIERYHYTLKSGCRLESLQLKQRDRLHRALATYAIVAWRLLWLTYLARREPERSVEGILEPAEWRSLYGTIFQTTTPPPQPPSLGECIQWIGALGGFLGRKGDGEPGVCSLWRGIQRLHDITATWTLLDGIR